MFVAAATHNTQNSQFVMDILMNSLSQTTMQHVQLWQSDNIVCGIPSGEYFLIAENAC